MHTPTILYSRRATDAMIESILLYLIFSTMAEPNGVANGTDACRDDGDCRDEIKIHSGMHMRIYN